MTEERWRAAMRGCEVDHLPPRPPVYPRYVPAVRVAESVAAILLRLLPSDGEKLRLMSTTPDSAGGCIQPTGGWTAYWLWRTRQCQDQAEYLHRRQVELLGEACDCATCAKGDA